MYEPLHHKYRPQTFAQLVGQGAIAATLTNALQQNRIAPAYLFCGPRGTGKTSSARILAKSLNCLTVDAPTAEPCGKCDVCQSVTRGSSLDIVEIDAASNTGVDNIRELIERSQFAPVQCRYKVYVIDECLTGDTQVLTDDGTIRIDDPSIVGRKVLSYNEISDIWEFKPVVKRFEQGTRQTYTIATDQFKIKCTDNHLIRTDAGWVAAKDVKEGMRILSPASADAGPLSSSPHQWSTNLETVRSVEIAEVEPVYDIEVADNHNFVANGLLVHNCHMLSTAAFNALLKTLEEPPDRVVFVLATTDPQRVLPTIISRCQRFDFRRIPLPSMIEHLQYIAMEESIAIAPSATQLVAQISQGGLRDAESLLDQLSLQADEISVESVWDLVGAVPERDLLSLVRAIAADDSTALLERVRHLMDKGREPLIVLQSLVGFYRDLLIAKRAPAREDLVAITPPTWAEMTEFAQQLSASQLLASQQKLQTSEVQVKNTTQPRLWLEVTLTGLLPSALGALADLSGSPDQGRSQTVVNARPKAAPLPMTPPVAAPAPSAPPVSPPVAPAASPAPQSSPPSAVPAPSPSADSAPVNPPATPDPVQPPPVQPSAPSASPAISPTESGAIASTSSEPAAPNASAAGADGPTDTPPSPEVAFGSMADLWNKILAVLLPRGTQILMAQQGVLLGFDGVGAKVGFRSASLQKLAQSRVPNLEAAFESVFQRKIKVSLEVVTPEESPVVEVEEPPPAPPAPPVTRTPPSKPAPSDASYTQRPSAPPAGANSSAPSRADSNNSVSNNPVSNSPGHSDLASGPSANSSRADTNGSSARQSSPGPAYTNTSPAHNSSANSSPPSSPPSRLPSENMGNSRLDAPSGAMGFDQDQEKVKRFASFFNGEIVNLDGSEPTDSSNDASKKSSDPGPDVPF